MMRSEIAALPNGEYSFVDHFDGLGENPEPVKICVKITIKDDELLADWTGTSPQVKGAINCPIPYTYAATYAAVRFITDSSIPNFEGYMRPIKMIAPEGTVVNPVSPGACAARGVIGLRALDCMFGALSQAVPERVTGASDGGPVMVAIAGWHNGNRFVLNDCLLGSWGGSADHDGAEGVSTPGVNVTNCPVEIMESEYPVEIVRYGLVTDSGGAGKYRGALAIVKEYRVLSDEATLTVRSDRRQHPPYGLFGGKAGSSSWNIVETGSVRRVLPTSPMEKIQLRQGDVFRHQGAGGGGYGDPLERAPYLALVDVMEQKQSIETARLSYGIVIDPTTYLVDEPATRKFRRQMRESSNRKPGT
jgi:N-methylhydantoinase B